MTRETALYERDGAIVTITLNRPEKLNAFDDAAVEALSEALARFDTDPDANVAILHGAGRAFSTGADVLRRQLRPREELERFGGPQGRGADSGRLFTHAVNWKPVVAAVHGYVMGLAVGIALDCDLLVAGAGTRFQITETSRGLGGSVYWGLMRLRGAGAFGDEVALTGRWFTAEEAAAAGVINRLAPAGAHLETARELAETLNANPPLSVRSTVRARRREIARVRSELSAAAQPERLYLTEDFHEAALAFKEKRPPRPFRGR